MLELASQLVSQKPENCNLSIVLQGLLFILSFWKEKKPKFKGILLCLLWRNICFTSLPPGEHLLLEWDGQFITVIITKIRFCKRSPAMEGKPIHPIHYST